MAAFMYFFPGIAREQLCAGGTLTRALVDKAGLSGVLADVSTDKQVGLNNVNRGPGDASGCILVALSTDRARFYETRYQPDLQTWERVSDRLWIGVVNAGLPTPDDIRRDRQQAGYTIELGDGNQWRVPIVRRPDFAVDRWDIASTELPRDFLLKDGELLQPVQARYEQLWQDSAAIADKFFHPDGVVVESLNCEMLWVLQRSVEVLAVNYRLGAEEQNILRLVNSNNWSALLGCAVDVPAIVSLIGEVNDAEKKTVSPVVPSGVSSSNGHADETADIARAAGIST